MAKTVADLKNGLMDWLDEAGATNGLAGGSTSAEVLRWINRAYSDVLALLPNSREIGVMTATISLLANQEMYALPTDFQGLKNIEGGWHAGTVEADRFPVLPLPSVAHRLAYYNSGNRSSPTDKELYFYLMVVDGVTSIGFVPIPGTNSAASIKIWYWPTPTAFTTDEGIVLPWLENHDELISLKAAIKILAKTGMDFSLLAAHHDLAEKKLKDAISNLQQVGPSVIQFYDDGFE